MNQTNPTAQNAIDSLDKIIKKSRIHFYKPIQIAEILHRDRVHKDIQLDKLETYRNPSKVWRDKVSKVLVGRTSSSSAKYQDNLFDKNALPPELIVILGQENRKSKGSIEKYIYQKFFERFDDLVAALNYCSETAYNEFELFKFLDMFRAQAGLKRSTDKIYEIVVYSLFSSLIEAMEIQIGISVEDPDNPILSEFGDFSQKILGVEPENIEQHYPAKLFRVGVTNAADRGLDMWGNFGLAIQIKHLSLSEEMAESVVDSISADRIVIICKDAEEKVIYSLLSQIGWKSRIQAIITFEELNAWYLRALRGTYAEMLGKKIIDTLISQIKIEFPLTSENEEKIKFFQSRGYSF